MHSKYEFALLAARPKDRGRRTEDTAVYAYACCSQMDHARDADNEKV